MNFYHLDDIPDDLQQYFMPAPQLGLEATPELYVAKMVEVFREVRRVLRDDGTLFLNLGDSYAASGGGAHKDWHKNSGMSKSSSRGGVPHVAACDTSGKAPANSQARDCLCGSLCDACRKAYRIGKSHSDFRRVPMQSPSPSATSREHTESQCGHLPTSDSANQVGRNEAAILAAERSLIHAGEPLPASPVSTPSESVPQHLGQHSEASTQDDECLLCGRSLRDCVPASARMEDCTCGTEGGGSADRTIDTDVSDSAYLHCTTASLKPKDLVGIPWRVAFALQADGWYLRSDIIWHKPNPMPESVTDRPTKAHEYIFLLTKSARYYYDAEAIKEPVKGWNGSRFHDGKNLVQHPNVGKNRTSGKHAVMPKQSSGHRMVENVSRARLEGMDHDSPFGESRNARSVWTIATEPYSGAHFATFPKKLVEPCILAGTKVDDVVLDPFAGSGTVGVVALAHARKFIGIELNAEYVAMAERRILGDAPLLNRKEA